MPYFTEPEREQLYLNVKRVLFDTYEPTENIEGCTRMSTLEIFQRLQEHIPGDFYTMMDVGAWMIEGRFTTFTIGNMKMEWLLKKKQHAD